MAGMDLLEGLLIAGGAAIAGAAAYAMGKRPAAPDAGMKQDLALMQQTLNAQLIDQTKTLLETITRVREESRAAITSGFGDTQGKLAESMQHGRKEIADSLGKSQELLTERLEKLIKETADLKAASGRMVEIGGDIRNLNQILEGSKSRGSYGEWQMELLLKQAVPGDRLRFQHKVGEGIVDAAVLLEDRVLCIDSKFPAANLVKYYEAAPGPERDRCLSQFHADVRKRAKEISTRYIVPRVTLDFAIMFVPAEGVFLEIVGNHELHQALMDLRVVPASPNFLFVYFQALAVGFRGMAVEKQAQEIIHAILDLQVNFQKFQETFDVLGKHIGNAHAQFDKANVQAAKIAGTLDNLKLGQTGE